MRNCKVRKKKNTFKFYKIWMNNIKFQLYSFMKEKDKISLVSNWSQLIHHQ